MPDNLTGWRVLAMAVTPGDRMGFGSGSFKVNRPTEIRPVMPNQVTEGDSFTAGFSIMNRTPDQRELTVGIDTEGGSAAIAGQAPPTVSRQIVAAPYKRQTVWLPVTTTSAGTIQFNATAGDNIDRDGIRHTFEVRKRYSLETAATYGSTEDGTATENIVFPSDIRTDVGRVSVVVSPSVIANLEGAFKYLRDYPYTCWEQILTRGVMASHYQTLQPYLPAEFKWEGSKSTIDDMLARAAAYQAPNGGMCYFIAANRYVSPYLSAYTALAFNWLRADGKVIPPAVEERLHDYLKQLLRRNVLPDFYTRGMASTVRAVALAALAENGEIDRSDVLRYRPHVDQMSLFGKAHYLMAAQSVPETEKIQSELVDLILAHSGQSGGKFIFSETIDDSYSRILSSALRTNAAVLSAILRHAKTPQGRAQLGDIPFKIVRFITQTRENRDHWENTQENMFCMNALVNYSRAYEQRTPRMSVKARLDQAQIGQAEFKSLRDDAVEFEHPIQETDPGRKAVLHLQKTGEGRYYYATRLFYAPAALKKEPVNAGIEIKREYSVERGNTWVMLKTPMQIKRGELVRVDLFVSLPSARNFVVVDDPVPGGLEPVNRDLATASTVDAAKGAYRPSGGSWWFRYSDWSSYGVSRWSFYHQEMRHHSVRFYSDFLPAGNYHLSYTAQAIAPGEFAVLPVHAEEMYDPDVYGKGVPGQLTVAKD